MHVFFIIIRLGIYDFRLRPIKVPYKLWGPTRLHCIICFTIYITICNYTVRTIHVAIVCSGIMPAENVYKAHKICLENQDKLLQRAAKIQGTRHRGAFE